MAITRTELITLAAAELGDDGKVEISIRPTRTEIARIKVDPDEARAFAAEISAAADDADRYATEQADR
jgi:hypothetical protein